MKLRIKELCKTKDITVTELAARVGITQPNMSNIANGKTTPSLELLERISAALGVSVSELFEPSDPYVCRCPKCGAVLRVGIDMAAERQETAPKGENNG